MLNDPVKRPQHLVQQCVERMLKQMMKPFKRPSTCEKCLKPVPPTLNLGSRKERRLSYVMFNLNISKGIVFSWVIYLSVCPTGDFNYV